MSRDRAALALVALVTLVVVGLYVDRTLQLVAYPFDWSPDEGLHLDYARRALHGTAPLYQRSVVPFPAAYGPLLPLLMAPFADAAQPLHAARLLALGWTLLGTLALALLLRRAAGVAWALAGAALWLAPFDLSFWNALVRVDAPMLALWLWAAVFLLPRSLDRGAGRLRAAPLAAGVVLVLAASLVKATAVLHAAPLVAGWLWVDRRSGLRLAAGILVAGAATFALLQLATGGAFLWVTRLWLLHANVPGQASLVVQLFAALAWPMMLLALLALLAAARTAPHREPAVLLVAGGLAAIPTLGKEGSWWNYLLPLGAALVVATGSWMARAATTPGRSACRVYGPVLGALVALALASTRRFPLPSEEDRQTAQAFYGFTDDVVRRAGGPILVSRPDLAYVRAGQPVEIEGSSFPSLALLGTAGAERVESRLLGAEYTMVLETWPLPRLTPWADALHREYRYLGSCRLGWYFGSLLTHVNLRRDVAGELPHGAGVRCRAATGASATPARRQ